MTFLFYSAAQDSGSTTIWSLSEKLVEARRKNLPTGSLALRRVPNGFYSVTLAEYAGLLLEGGIATRKSPLKITEEGKSKLAESISEIRRRNEQQSVAWLTFLGLPT